MAAPASPLKGFGEFCTLRMTKMLPSIYVIVGNGSTCMILYLLVPLM